MLGFVAYMQMDYEQALQWYDKVIDDSGCELERLVADVGRMKVYLRAADNLAFFNCRAIAMQRLAHIEEELDGFMPAEKARLNSVVNDLRMVTALHHHMMGQRPEAHAELANIEENDQLRADTVQWLMLQYLKGLGLGVEVDTREQRILRRYTHLNTCLREGREGGYTYFEGAALSGLSELLSDTIRSGYVAQNRPNSYSQLIENDENKVFSLLNDALRCLQSYGDRYGVANAKVVEASLLNKRGDYTIALDTLFRLLEDSVLMPNILCRLHEEASVAYAGLGNKQASDNHRNLYLDLLETTRQDKELEGRYIELKRQRRTMTLLLGIVVVGATLFVVIIALLSRRRRNHKRGYEHQLREVLAETEKRVYLHQLHVAKGKRDNVVRKATFSMMTGMIPYVDRMAHEVERLQRAEVWDDIVQRERKLNYIAELSDEINHQNEVLAQWVKTTQGVVNLHIETFALSDVLNMIERSNANFTLKGLILEVQPTEAVVKADKALTFFMLNTLADNARKFTPEGGRVVVGAQICDDYVEIFVKDNGIGMSPQDITRIMREKVYNAAEIGHDLPPEQRKNKGSGFGLLNCKGIIEKYRKTDALFELCQFGIDSRIGEGSRFWFRLPKGVRRLMALLCVTLFPWGASAQVQEPMFSDAPQVDTLLVHAAIFADSVYFANVDGRYEEALAFADSAILYLNAHHRKYAKEYIAPLTSNRGETDVEIRWWLSDYATDYHTILDVRNEMAVANLALRRWHEYRYNNRIYNDLYILISEDRSLIDYCTRMQRYNSNISIAILICVLLALGYLAVLIYTFMERVGVVYRDIETVEDDERRVRHEENRLHVQNMVLDNCLSTIKHETIYYPNRIKQLVNRINEHDERLQMKELVDYYKVVFTTLTECASRQLDEVTFRRAVVDVGRLLQGAVAYHRKRYRNSDSKVLVTDAYEGKVTCDNDLIGYLFEQLIDAALLMSPVSELQLTVKDDGDFVRFVISSNTCTFTEDMLESLFYPSRISTGPMSDGYLQGAEYIVCRQIIREHDDNFNHIGCRIKAEPTSEGYMVWFTLPKVLA
jgi:signal transduction histidine kinase